MARKAQAKPLPTPRVARTERDRDGPRPTERDGRCHRDAFAFVPGWQVPPVPAQLCFLLPGGAIRQLRCSLRHVLRANMLPIFTRGAGGRGAAALGDRARHDAMEARGRKLHESMDVPPVRGGAGLANGPGKRPHLRHFGAPADEGSGGHLDRVLWFARGLDTRGATAGQALSRASRGAVPFCARLQERHAPPPKGHRAAARHCAAPERQGWLRQHLW